MFRLSVGAVAATLLAVGAFADHRDLAAGSEIVVRTNEAIDSKDARPGQVYSAVIDRDITSQSGTVVIPRGSNAELVIRDYSSGGTVGSRELVLDLQSVSVGGRRYYVGATSTQKGRKAGLGKNERTAKMTGGGAALGAIIGAIAGGGKGAAIGAVTGAAAGAATQVLTRGKEVRVPAESLLTFRLDNPLRLETR